MTLKTAALLGLFLILGSCSKKEEAVIFVTARLEGRISAEPDSALKGALAGGVAVFKNLYKLEGKPKLALDMGNWLSETSEGRVMGAQAVLDCLDAVPYSAAAPGYRDLALAPRELEKLSKTVSFPLLASNLYLKNNRKPDFLRGFALLEAGGHKIGVFAINVADPQKANQPKNLLNYHLEKESYEIEKALKALKDGGAKITVMLLNINPKASAKPEFYRKFLEKLPKTDLIITDEPSLKKPFKAGKSWVVPSGLGSSAARIRLYIDPVAGTLTAIDWDLLPLDKAKYGEDPAALEVVNRHLHSVTRYMERRIGFLSTELKLRDGGRSAMGDFAAGCMKRWAHSNAALLVNSDLAAGISSGPVTVGDIYRVMPYDTSVVFVKIRGAELADALEDKVLSDISVSGLKIIAGETGIKSVETDSGPLVPGHVYRLAVPDSIVNNADYPILPNAMEFANSKRFLREILGWCFSLRKISAPEPEAEMRDTNGARAEGSGRHPAEGTPQRQASVQPPPAPEAEGPAIVGQAGVVDTDKPENHGTKGTE
ncbi:MAG: 5'-nucleotidase C-terminal domain-containing protein [Elusimicrobia bacterium]|nr:5'-nucleotidase C-terminal domain-containing protein [Elusimicrobiota bacterium]